MSSTVPRYTTNGNTQDLSEDARNWNDLAYALEQEGGITKANKLFKRDGQLSAFTTSDAITSPVTFGIKSSGSDSTILVTISNSNVDAKTGHAHSAIFTLSALPFQWREFFKPIPPVPYQSYWGMFGMNIKQPGTPHACNETLLCSQNPKVLKCLVATSPLLIGHMCGVEYWNFFVKRIADH